MKLRILKLQSKGRMHTENKSDKGGVLITNQIITIYLVIFALANSYVCLIFILLLEMTSEFCSLHYHENCKRDSSLGKIWFLLS